MNSRFARFAAALAVASLVAVPMFAARGSANFTTFVAVGDSYGAGFENSGLSGAHQVFSWPAIVARQVGLTICQPNATAADNCFALPLVAPPGIGSQAPGTGELVLNDIINYPPSIVPAVPGGSPLMTTFGRPYNDLSVPGYTVGATLALTGKESSGYGPLILRGLGTEVDQAISLHPTFIAVWIGGNDFLGSVTQGTTAGLTPLADFTAQYNAMLDKLIAGAPNAGMVVGNLPTNPAGVPFLNTVSRFLINPATRLPVTLPNGSTINLVYDAGNGTVAPVGANDFITLAASSLIGTGFGIPAALAPAFPQLPNAGKPLPGSVVLTADEFATIQSRIKDYNTVITQAASARNIPVADVAGLFDRVASGKLFVGPFNVTGAFITGGFFSLDGIHPTDLGYTLFANEFIKAINKGYGTEIPVASIANTLFANNGAMFATLSGMPVTTDMAWTFSDEASAAVQGMLTTPAPAPQSSRRRATVH